MGADFTNFSRSFTTPGEKVRRNIDRRSAEIELAGQVCHLSEHAGEYSSQHNIVLHLEIKAIFATIPTKD